MTCNHYGIESFCQECYINLLKRFKKPGPTPIKVLTCNPNNEDNSWIKDKFRIDYMLNENITIQQLGKICKKYDEHNGEWPESCLEGFSVLKFILAELKLIEDNWDYEGMYKLGFYEDKENNILP